MNKICFTCKQETLSSKCCNKRTVKKCNIVVVLRKNRRFFRIIIIL